MGSPYIYVSGVMDDSLYFNDNSHIDIDLGIPDNFGQIWLSSIETSFGFNDSPHTLNLEIVAKNQLPNRDIVGNNCVFQIGELLFNGHIVHVDNSVGSNGFITRIQCEDGRKIELNKYLIHTESLLQNNLNNVIIVPKVLNTRGNLHKKYSPLWLMNRYGATYSEIYNAATSEGVVGLPSPSIINNKLGDYEGYRWQFSMTPLFSALLQIFDDCGYDLYYYGNEIRIIDRSKTIRVDTSFLDDYYKTEVREGYDLTSSPTRHSVLGAKKQGSVGTIDFCEYHNEISLGKNSFTPAWNDIQIQYHNQDGILNSYYPTDDELRMALKGIEFWIYYKLEEGIHVEEGWMESRLNPAVYGINDNLAMLSAGGGRSDVIKAIQNRRSEAANWLVTWYDAVSNHARRYYGKLYSCIPGESFLRNCNIVDSAWIADNVDNMTIPLEYSPFYDDGKIRAFMQISTDDVIGYGLKGTDVPASFVEWNEMDGNAYIPIQASIYSPSDDSQRIPGMTEQRVLLRLPNIIVTDIYVHELLENLSTLDYFDGGTLNASGISDQFQLYVTAKDKENPRLTIQPLQSIDNFLIPVEYNIRYGDSGDTTYGTTNGEYAVEINDKYAPWTKENPSDPTRQMLHRAQEMISSSGSVDFYEATVVGLPSVNYFSDFADRNGEAVYPFTSMNVRIGGDGLTTQYAVKTQLKELIRDNKIDYSRWKSRLNHIQHYSNLDKLMTNLNLIMPGLSQGIIDDLTKDNWNMFQTATNNKEEEENVPEDKSYTKMVKIVDVASANITDPNGAETQVVVEFYTGQDDNGNVYPFSWKNFYRTIGEDVFTENKEVDIVNFGETTTRRRMMSEGYCMCTDGYLRPGMSAMFHHEEIEGTVFEYFTGGVQLESARVVEIANDVEQIGDYYCADVKTVSHIADTASFNFYKVPFLNNTQAGMQSYKVGDKVQIVHNRATKGGSSTSSDSDFDVFDEGTLRPESTHIKDDEPVNDLYIENPKTINPMFVTVVTPPLADGTGGKVAKADDPTQTYEEFPSENGEMQDLLWIGCPYDAIYEGDYGILTQGKEGWYVLIQKPLFTAYSQE